MTPTQPQNCDAGREAPPGCGTGRLLGESVAIEEVRCQIRALAKRLATVLIEGETGVGKEVVAREIHACSSRAQEPFVPVDCTAFSGQLIESQLFGHVKGAFTGAVAAALGFVRCADGGTLFLDEIGELPLEVQAKLLRCLQERTVVPVGGVEAVKVDVRIVAATHRNLATMVQQRLFRQDLFFRLNVVRLDVKPLRDRPDDVVLLAMNFLAQLASLYEEPVKSLSDAAQCALRLYEWPGNVRELRNVVERALLFCNDRTIELAHLPEEFRARPASAGNSTAVSEKLPSLAEAEGLLVARALRVTGGNQSQAAQLLDVERHRLRRMISRHGLDHLLSATRR